MRNLRRIIQILACTSFLILMCNGCEKEQSDSTNPLIGTWENKEFSTNYSYSSQITFNPDQTGLLYFLEQSLLSDNKFEETDSIEWSTSQNKLEISYINKDPISTTEVYYEINSDTLELVEIIEGEMNEKIILKRIN